MTRGYDRTAFVAFRNGHDQKQANRVVIRRGLMIIHTLSAAAEDVHVQPVLLSCAL